MSLAPTQSIQPKKILAQRLTDARASCLKPAPRLNLVEWADTYRRVSPKNSANPGQWRTARQPAAIGPMLACTERDTNTVTIEAGTQILKSEVLINIAGYFIDQDPASILFVQPTQDLASSFAKERWDPTRDVTPCLRDKIADRKSRKSDNTIDHKDYPGGTMDFVGANVPGDLASRPKRVVLSDEIDKWPASAGKEGDPLKLAEERSSTFWNRLFVRVCSPTVKGDSRIDEEYQASDQRRCFVACPHCGHRQTLKFRENVQWDKDEDGNHLPETAQYYCEDCGAGWTEAQRVAAIRGIIDMKDHGWRQTKKFKCCGEVQAPELWDDNGRAICPKCENPVKYHGHAGFHASKLLSIRHRLQDIVQEWIDCNRDLGDGSDKIEKLKKFINTALAEVFEEAADEADEDSLMARLEDYSQDDLPDGVHFATMGIDVHPQRLECETVGWGLNDESWGIRYDVIHGDVATVEPWIELDRLRKQKFFTESGRMVKVRAACVDVNDSQTSAYAYGYCDKRRRQYVHPIRGRAGGVPIFPKRTSKTKTGQIYFACGSDAAKGWVYGSFGVAEPGPRYAHLNMEYDKTWAEQATSERVITAKEKSGRSYKKWILRPGRRNEALDCRAYAVMAMKSLSVNQRRPSRVSRQEGQEAEAVAIDKTEPELDQDGKTALKPKVRRRRTTRAPRRRSSGGGFVKGF